MIADCIIKVILTKIRKAKYYSIIIDCTPDASHKEQVTFIILFIDINSEERNFDIREDFIGSCQIRDTTGKGLTEFVLTKLKDL